MERKRAMAIVGYELEQAHVWLSKADVWLQEFPGADTEDAAGWVRNAVAEVECALDALPRRAEEESHERGDTRKGC